MLDRIAGGRRVSVEREVFPGIVADRALFAFPSAAYWTDTGTPAQYLQAQLDIVAGRRPGSPPPARSPTATASGGMGAVTIEGDVQAPALLGVDARVAAAAMVRNSVVGAGAVVDEGAVVVDSVLLPGGAGGGLRRGAGLDRRARGRDRRGGVGHRRIGHRGQHQGRAGSNIVGARLPEGAAAGTG